jgi:lysozyme
MNEDRELTQAGVNLIKHFESCMKRVGKEDKYKAYKCPAGVWTCGWGTTSEHGHKISPDTVWTMQQCNDIARKDMLQFTSEVRKMVKVLLHPWQFDALVSFAYNCGSGALKGSTLLKKVNAGDHAGAVKEFPKWNKANGKVLAGLTRRRASEALLYQNIPDENYDGKPDAVIKPFNHPMPQAVDKPEGE